ncbi:MAG TPA: Nramp family divalent metal transporter [Ornithinimicrobium sp.]|uniref:Nramp family divalent metal transporter n=1 Tax=Ornithinimicrobium sp. TaxID=1977084 RepID=UPI002B493092|nr:Nramp family divalent metal transporter [Ornithinimicrobium sp.]HKJ11363.1 Nramp family divalent metal transporter [Ornithinimicrobium sp.]
MSEQTADSEAPQEKRSLKTTLKNLGPGLLVAAAFIGPGTVTTASVAGSSYGFALLWAIVFSVVAAIVLQEMCARLGVVSREGLGEALRSTFDNAVIKVLAIILVIGAITIGTAAFEGGNLTGAALALDTVFGGGTTIWSLLVAALAAGLLATGSYRVVERVLVWLVVAMGIVFLVTAVMVTPSIGELLSGLVPTAPTGSTLTVVALIGTTVVPYNLFLHASSVQDKWGTDVPTDLAVREAKLDTRLSVSIGGLVTIAILTTAAAALFGTGNDVKTAADMATALEPLLGPVAEYFFAFGLLAAGVTSSVTAPLAAAYGTAGAFGWKRDLADPKFKAIWALIIVVGATFAAIGSSPTELIVFAQAANGLILPIIAVFLLVVMNRSDLLGKHTNGRSANIIGGIVVLVAIGLGVQSLLAAFGVVG